MTARPDDDRFDAAMRGLHAQALSQVSAATTSQLHRRRHAALQDGTRSRRPPGWRAFGWPAAAAFASLLVVAIGLGFGLQTTQEQRTPAPAVADVGPQADDFDDDAYAALDENPDFFLWLASSDATLLAME